MELDWRDEIFKQFPGFFERGADITCCEGWKDLVTDTIKWIRSFDPNITCEYIEDEFGLRFGLCNLYEHHEPKLTDVLSTARQISQSICEKCGKKATVRESYESGWPFWAILCDDCYRVFND